LVIEEPPVFECAAILSPGHEIGHRGGHVRLEMADRRGGDVYSGFQPWLFSGGVEFESRDEQVRGFEP
jgi:hypothetical protein